MKNETTTKHKDTQAWIRLLQKKRNQLDAKNNNTNEGKREREINTRGEPALTTTIPSSELHRAGIGGRASQTVCTQKARKTELRGSETPNRSMREIKNNSKEQEKHNLAAKLNKTRPSRRTWERQQTQQTELNRVH